MAEKREIIACTIFNVQAAYISRLWTPETTDFKTGKPLEKPRYSVSVRIPKTKGRWFDEPALASVVAGSKTLYSKHFPGFHIDRLIWPVKDGDRPNDKNVVPDWSKGHWFVRADTTSPDYLSIEVVQNGKAEPLPAPKLGGRTIVKDGDYCILSIGIAKSEGTSPGLKTYLNGIVFTGQGEAISLGARVSSDELLRQAREQGLQITGINAPAAGFGGQPQQSDPFASGQGGSRLPDGIPF